MRDHEIIEACEKALDGASTDQIARVAAWFKARTETVPAKVTANEGQRLLEALRTAQPAPFPRPEWPVPPALIGEVRIGDGPFCGAVS
jgi:hypothetical protein